MNRRGFLALLGAVAADAVLDPERALWVPGARTISIPAPGLSMTIRKTGHFDIRTGAYRWSLRRWPQRVS